MQLFFYFADFQHLKNEDFLGAKLRKGTMREQIGNDEGTKNQFLPAK